MLEKWVTMTDDRMLCRRVMNTILKRYLLGARSRALVSWRAFIVAAQNDEIEHKVAVAAAKQREIAAKASAQRRIENEVRIEEDRVKNEEVESLRGRLQSSHQELAEATARVGEQTEATHAANEEAKALRGWLQNTHQELSETTTNLSEQIQATQEANEEAEALRGWLQNTHQELANVTAARTKNHRLQTEAAQAANEAETRRCELVVRRCVQRMALNTTARTFDRWAEFAAQSKEYRRQLGLAVARWKRRGLAAVIDRWITMVDERVLCRRVLTKLLRRYLHGARSRAMASWCNYTRDERAAAATEKQREWDSEIEAKSEAEAEAKRVEAIISRCLRRMGSTAMARMLDRWTAYVAHVKEERRRIIFAAAEEAAAIGDQITSERELCRRVMTRMVCGYMHGAQTAAMCSWRLHTREMQDFERREAQAKAESQREMEAKAEEEVEAKRREAVVSRCIRRMASNATARTFDRWAEFATQSKEYRRQLGLAVARWQRRGLAAVVNCWITMVDEKVLCRRVLNKLFHRHLHGARLRAIVSWRAFTRDAKIESRAAYVYAKAAEEERQTAADRIESIQRDFFEAQNKALAASALLDKSAKTQRELREEVTEMKQSANRSEAQVVELKQALATSDEARRVEEERSTTLASDVRDLREQLLEMKETSHVAIVEAQKTTETVTKKRRQSSARHDSQIAILQSRERENREQAQLAEARMFEAQASVAFGLGRSIILRWAEGMHGLQQEALRKAFTTWQAGTAELLQQEQRAGRALRWWRRRGIAQAFAAWIDLVEVRCRCRRVLERMTRQGDMGLAARAFHRLRVFIAEHDKAALRSELIEVKQVLERHRKASRRDLLQAHSESLASVNESARTQHSLRLELTEMRHSVDRSQAQMMAMEQVVAAADEVRMAEEERAASLALEVEQMRDQLVEKSETSHVAVMQARQETERVMLEKRTDLVRHEADITAVHGREQQAKDDARHAHQLLQETQTTIMEDRLSIARVTAEEEARARQSLAEAKKDTDAVRTEMAALQDGHREELDTMRGKHAHAMSLATRAAADEAAIQIVAGAAAAAAADAVDACRQAEAEREASRNQIRVLEASLDGVAAALEAERGINMEHLAFRDETLGREDALRSEMASEKSSEVEELRRASILELTALGSQSKLMQQEHDALRRTLAEEQEVTAAALAAASAEKAELSCRLEELAEESRKEAWEHLRSVAAMDAL